MNKIELVDAIAEKTGCPKNQTKAMLEAFFTTTVETLKKGDKISLIGFGTFSVNKRAARTGRNPITQQKIMIPAKTVAKFKPGSGFDNL
jgi:DNA-binding protein HU-beta